MIHPMTFKRDKAIFVAVYELRLPRVTQEERDAALQACREHMQTEVNVEDFKYVRQNKKDILSVKLGVGDLPTRKVMAIASEAIAIMESNLMNQSMKH